MYNVLKAQRIAPIMETLANMTSSDDLMCIQLRNNERHSGYAKTSMTCLGSGDSVFTFKS